jgi:hypothetical protein
VDPRHDPSGGAIAAALVEGEPYQPGEALAAIDRDGW